MTLFENTPYDPSYIVLTNAVKQVGTSGPNGPSVEIGVRKGDSSYIIMQTLKESGSPRVHIGIDPYGNIDYRDWETCVRKLDYTNDMRNKAMKNLWQWCTDNDYDFIYMPLEDTEFFKRFEDGVPVYNEVKTIVNEYSLVFYDGPHTTADVLREIEFFSKRTQVGGMWVFDDVQQYPHMEKVHPVILEYGFELVENDQIKASYKKVR